MRARDLIGAALGGRSSGMGRRRSTGMAMDEDEYRRPEPVIEEVGEEVGEDTPRSRLSDYEADASEIDPAVRKELRADVARAAKLKGEEAPDFELEEATRGSEAGRDLADAIRSIRFDPDVESAYSMRESKPSRSPSEVSISVRKSSEMGQGPMRHSADMDESMLPDVEDITESEADDEALLERVMQRGPFGFVRRSR